MTFPKTWWGPLLIRIQVFKIRKHLCLPLLFQGDFPPLPLTGPWPLGCLVNLALETASLSGKKAE